MLRTKTPTLLGASSVSFLLGLAGVSEAGGVPRRGIARV